MLRFKSSGDSAATYSEGGATDREHWCDRYGASLRRIRNIFFVLSTYSEVLGDKKGASDFFSERFLTKTGLFTDFSSVASPLPLHPTSILSQFKYSLTSFQVERCHIPATDSEVLCRMVFAKWRHFRRLFVLFYTSVPHAFITM